MTATVPSSSGTTFKGPARPGTGFAAMAAVVHGAPMRAGSQPVEAAVPGSTTPRAAEKAVAKKAGKKGGATKGGQETAKGSQRDAKGPSTGPNSFGSAKWRATVAKDQARLLRELKGQGIVSLEGREYVVQHNRSIRKLTAAEAALVTTPISKDTSNEDVLRVKGLLLIVQRTLEERPA